jgi:hypothetical protein
MRDRLCSLRREESHMTGTGVTLFVTLWCSQHAKLKTTWKGLWRSCWEGLPSTSGSGSWSRSASFIFL